MAVPLRPNSSPGLNLIKNAKIVGSSEVDGVEKRKGEAEEGESFDPAGRPLVAEVVAAIAELLLPEFQKPSDVSLVGGESDIKLSKMVTKRFQRQMTHMLQM